MTKVACVTGCDRGLGLALTGVLLAAGYKVFAGRLEESSRGLEDLKLMYGKSLRIVQMDVSSDEGIRAAAEAIASGTGHLDLIVNNAAILGDITANAEDPMDFAELERVLSVNAVGPLRVTQALFGLLMKGDMKLVVNISSEAGSIAQSHRTSWFGYCMSKAALNMQSTMVHRYLMEKGGQVLIIHPDWMQTYMRGQLDREATYTPEESARSIKGLIEDHKRFLGEQPAYINTQGERLPW